MRNEILSSYFNEQSQEVLASTKRWDEPKTNVLTMDELIRSNRELEQFAFNQRNLPTA